MLDLAVQLIPAWGSADGNANARVAERQTRWLQVPVSERAWGFKSPLAHHKVPIGSSTQKEIRQDQRIRQIKGLDGNVETLCCVRGFWCVPERLERTHEVFERRLEIRVGQLAVFVEVEPHEDGGRDVTADLVLGVQVGALRVGDQLESGEQGFCACGELFVGVALLDFDPVALDLEFAQSCADLVDGQRVVGQQVEVVLLLGADGVHRCGGRDRTFGATADIMQP